MKNLKTLSTLLVLTVSFASFALFGIGEDKKDSATKEISQEKLTDECQAPSWAIAIGHEQKWKLHKGCPLEQIPETTPKLPPTK